MKRRSAVTWDEDLTPKRPSAIIIGEELSTLSLAELETRILALQNEIERVRSEIKAKKAHEEAAASFFKR
jgi:uncharacterized small protein (DUF1192 family)